MASTSQNNDVVSVEDPQKAQSTPSSVFKVFESLAVRTVAVVVMYGSGYFDINPIWLVVIWGMFKYRDQKRLERIFRREAASAIAMRDERKLVLSNVKHIPSWVRFPDTEHCEWLNKIIGHVLPSVQTYVSNKDLNAILEKEVSKFVTFSNCSLQSTSLGSCLPRVSGIKVHNANSEMIIVDIHVDYVSDISFYGSASVQMLVPIPVTYGISDFEITGVLRTVIYIPKESLIPGVEISFLRQPKVEFDLKGLTNLGDFKPIGGKMRSTIDDIIKDKVVFPNRIVITSIEDDKLKFIDPKGLLRVCVVEAKSLKWSEGNFFYSSKQPDPYVKITFGPKEYISPSVKSSEDPKWDFTADFIIDSYFDDTVMISVEDLNENRKLGNIPLSMKLIESKTSFDSWIRLEEANEGMIHLRVSFHKLESSPQLMTGNGLPALLEVRIDDAKDLVNGKNVVNACITVGDDKKKSRSVPANNPVFEEVFLFLVKNPDTEKLRVELTDLNGKNVGNTDFDIRNVLIANNMEVTNQESMLTGATKNSRLSLSIRLRTFKPV